MRWKWPDEVVEWLRENVPGRTTKEVTVLINQQGFDEKYGMVFTESSVKGGKEPVQNPERNTLRNPERNTVKCVSGGSQSLHPREPPGSRSQRHDGKAQC